MNVTLPPNEQLPHFLISVKKFIDENIKNSPYLISIGERAQDIANSYNNNQVNSEDTLKMIKEMYNDLNRSRKDEERSGLPKNVFAFYYFMKKANMKEPEDLANTFGEMIKKFPAWHSNVRQEMVIKRRIIKSMLKSGTKPSEAATLVKETLERLRKGIKNGTF